MNFEIVTNIFIFSANVTTKVFLYNDPPLKKFKGSKKYCLQNPLFGKKPTNTYILSKYANSVVAFCKVDRTKAYAYKHFFFILKAI